MTISTEQAIMNLMAAYSYCVDDGDFAGFGDLFAHGEYVAAGTSVRGSKAVEAFATDALRIHEDGTPRTRHVVTNISLHVDDEAGTATARAYYTVFQALADFPLRAVGGGQYRDRFERVDGEWRFAKRTVTIDMVGDTSRLMRS